MKQKPAYIFFCWTPIIGAGLTNGRWIELQQEKWTLQLRPNWQTAEVEEVREHWVSDNPRVITDRDTSWMSGECINDILTEPEALLTSVRYFPGDVNPEWPYVLAAIQIHDGNNCNDPNAIYLPIEYDVDDQGNWSEGLNPELLAQANNQPGGWTSEEERLNAILNAPTIIEEGYIPDPNEIDGYGMAIEQSGNNHPAVNTNVGMMDIIDYGDEGATNPSDPQGGTGNGLRKRGPANSESSENDGRPSRQNLGLPEPNMHLGEIITANINDNADPVINLDTAAVVRDEQFFRDRADSMNAFIDATTPSNSDVAEQNRDELSRIPSSEVLDYDSLVEPYRNLPVEDESEDMLLILEANMLERGLRFGRPTSIRLVSDTSQRWIAPGIVAPVLRANDLQALREFVTAQESLADYESGIDMTGGYRGYQRSQ
ncbi:hypothetical protein TWF696_004900 [Orbilia brochopaga]|uniref:Uncharacterized protein n=1 Tax=Orbilia brochopaga TaxID=3140254 RepID=A0AAV9V2D1_9PEZI